MNETEQAIMDVVAEHRNGITAEDVMNELGAKYPECGYTYRNTYRYLKSLWKYKFVNRTESRITIAPGRRAHLWRPYRDVDNKIWFMDVMDKCSDGAISKEDKDSLISEWMGQTVNWV